MVYTHLNYFIIKNRILALVKTMLLHKVDNEFVDFSKTQIENIESLKLWFNYFYIFDPDIANDYRITHMHTNTCTCAHTWLLCTQILFFSWLTDLLATIYFQIGGTHFCIGEHSFVSLAVWAYLDWTEFSLLEMGESKFSQNMAAFPFSTVTTCLMGCNSIFIIL